MKLIKLSELFEISYGTKFDMNKMTDSTNILIPFISRTSKNNGISGYVDRFNNIEPLKKGQITVSLGGTYVLSCFLQEQDFYTGQNVAVLKSKLEFSKEQKLYYCIAITKNRFRYGAFGREANRTLKDITVPDPSEIPEFIFKANFSTYDNLSNKYHKKQLSLKPDEWENFRYDEIFDIQKGYYNKRPPLSILNTGIPFIGAAKHNNGTTGLISLENIKKHSKVGSIDLSQSIEKKVFKGNCITVANNGSSVASAFYQPNDFTCSHDINPLYLKNNILNKYIAMFLITLIQAEQYRWGFGRKWRPARMPESIIRLPINEQKQPCYKFMESYIKSLPFSKSL